jgi:putative transcriptional regulator
MELIEARKQARYSQQDAADHLGISRPTYAKMESNPETITLLDARRIAEFFGVQFNDIFFESNYK